MDNNNLEKAKEILRQGELRINGIMEFSKELDDKIFKLLAANIGVVSALLFFILNTYSSMNLSFLSTSIFAFVVLCSSIVFLLLAGKPAEYKGVGLPLTEFDDNKSLEEILTKSKSRYTARFDNNAELNKKKSIWLEHAIYTLAFMPVISALFYLQTLLLPIVVIVISHLFVIAGAYCAFRYFVIKQYSGNKNT